MAFWSMTSSLSMAGATEKVLDRDSFDLKDLLDCDDILNQVLAPNDRVIRYLSQPDVVEELVDFAIAPPLTRHPVREDSISRKNEENDGEDDSKQSNEEKSKDSKDTEESSSLSELNDAKQSGESTAHTNNKVKDRDSEHDDYQDNSNSVKGDNEKYDDISNEKESEKEEEPVDSYRSFSPADEISSESVEYHEFQDEESGDTDLDGESDEEFEEERLRQIRYSKVSAEILTTDVWMLLDALLSNETAMNRLWSLLEKEPEATSQQLGLLTKIVEGLLEKRLDRMLDFVRTLPHFVDYFIRYIECQPLVDFLIKIISTDHPESPTDIIDFLYEQDLIPKMIELLGPDVPHSAQSAAGDFLKAFVNISGGNKSDICAIGPNELSRQFVGTKCMDRLIDIMLNGGHGMCVAVTVIIEAIRKNNSDYDMIEVTDTTLESHPPEPRDNIYLGTMVKLFAQAIPKFQEMLVAPETKMMKMPFGEVKPLGFVRFRICELYAELLHCSNMNLLNDPMGEEIVQERDAERNRVFFPERELPNLMPPSSDGQDRKLDSNNDKENEESQQNPESLPVTTIEAVDPTERDEDSGEEVLGDSETEDASSPIGSSDLSQSANAPGSSRPTSPAEIIDSPPPTPSPPTPNDESGDELEYIDDNRQKINVSNYRGKQLEAYLERENKSLRRRAVVGDQLKFALDDNHCIDAVLRMLFEFPWNNFLHNVVFDIVQQVFNGYIDHSYNKFLAIHLFTRAHLTEQIVKGQRGNEDHEREKNIRLGYVGHLTLISEEVVKFGSLFVPESVSPEIAEALSDRDWIEYVHNDLLQLREQYNTVLGKVSLVSEEEDSYDIQDEDDRRVLVMELNMAEDNDSRLRQLQPRSAGIDSDSDSDTDSESESDSDGEDAIPKSRDDDSNENDDDDDDDDDDDVQDADYGDFEEDDGNEASSSIVGRLPKLSPQKKNSGREENQDYGDEDTSLARLSSNDNKPKMSNKDKIPKDASEFARYMSRQLNSDQFSSGSSEEEEEEEVEEEDKDKEAWVPVDGETSATKGTRK